MNAKKLNVVSDKKNIKENLSIQKGNDIIFYCVNLRKEVEKWGKYWLLPKNHL